MARTPTDAYDEQTRALQSAVEQGEVSEQDAELIHEFVNMYDADQLYPELPKRPRDVDKRDPRYKVKKTRTLASYLERVRRVAAMYDGDLADATAKQLNVEVMQAGRDGDHPDVKDGGWSINTVRNYQFALRMFYFAHEHTDQDLTIEDHREILVFQRDDDYDTTPFNPRDILTRDEIRTISDAAKHPRDKAIFRFLIYTGVRNGALRKMKWRNIDLQEEVYHFPEEDGLKSIHQPKDERPLGLAAESLRVWKDMHPEPEPDAYVFCAKPAWARVDPYSQLTRETPRRVMADLKEETGIEKPMHPHMMRHNFVTICKRDYELPDDTVKWLIGHSPDSDVMTTTYAHLSDDDHRQRFEVAAGLRDDDEDEHEGNRFTPDICSVCGKETLGHERFCSKCGNSLVPDFQNVREETDEEMHESAKQVEPGSDEAEALTELKQLLAENPDLINELAAEEP